MRQPPPGQTTTLEPFASPAFDRNTVRVGLEMLRSMVVFAAKPIGGWKVLSGGTPRELITKLNADLARTMSAPDVRDRLAGDGAEPKTGTPEQFGAFLRAEIAQWTKVVKDAGIVAE